MVLQEFHHLSTVCLPLVVVAVLTIGTLLLVVLAEVQDRVQML
jgi:hypothetical protein